uniref:Uncharacterized protein n=1 Tax=Anguilla anguilla TaxID=7936 RepID=A0A0E9T4W6_ANGAN
MRMIITIIVHNIQSFLCLKTMGSGHTAEPSVFFSLPRLNMKGTFGYPDRNRNYG